MPEAMRAEQSAPAGTTLGTNSLRTLARWLLRAPRAKRKIPTLDGSGRAVHRDLGPRPEAQNRLDSLPDCEPLLLPEVPGRSCKRVRS